MKILRKAKNNSKYLLTLSLMTLALILFSSFSIGAADLNVSLSYREMIALGPEAEARLILVDQTAAESDLIIKDEQKKLANGVPVDFNLDLSEANLKADQNYTMLALINWQGDMIWTAAENFSGQKLLNGDDIQLLTKRTPARLLVFEGEKDFKVRFLGFMAQLFIDGQEYILPQQRTASGAKFANSKLSIWNKGRDIFYEKDGQSFESSLLSVFNLDLAEDVLVAKGQEPYWELEIDENTLKLKYDYLTNKLSVPMANVEVIEKASSLVYKVETSFLNFKISLLDDVHSDVMNGEIYPFTAFIRINGEKYIGGADLK